MTGAQESNAVIVAAVDGSSVSYHAVAWAAVDAALHRCRLHLVTSMAPSFGIGPMVTPPADVYDTLRADGERVLDEARRIVRTAVGGEAVEISTDLTSEQIIPHLIKASRRARMLVTGSRGLGAVRRGLLGSVSSSMVRHAQCPVAVVHSVSGTDAVSVSRPILVGVDGTSNSEPALEWGFEEASRRKVGLVALHAWSDMSGPYLPPDVWRTVRESEDAVLSESLAGWRERYPDVVVRPILVRDRPVRALLDESETAQLVVVGSHGRGGFTGMLLGSTSSALLQSVECPIIVVREVG